MRLLHYETFKPLCPACRTQFRVSRLELTARDVTPDQNVRWGVLRCSSDNCRRAYPIVNGAPVLVPDVATWLAGNLHLLLQGDVDDADVEALIGDSVGPDAAFNITRQQQSSYADDHYGDFFETRNMPAEGSVRQCLALALKRFPVQGETTLDIGCAVGRTTFDLAAASGAPALGVDLNWPLLKVARTIIETGVISYSRRRVGVAYDRRARQAALPAADRVDFWIADALALPFPADSVGFIAALNVLDCVVEPMRLLAELSRAVAPEGGVALATPFDWASHATPRAAWIEGAEELERAVASLRPGPNVETKALAPTAPPANVPWSIRLHDRSQVEYQTLLMTLRAAPDANPQSRVSSAARQGPRKGRRT